VDKRDYIQAHTRRFADGPWISGYSSWQTMILFSDTTWFMEG